MEMEIQVVAIYDSLFARYIDFISFGVFIVWL